MLLRYKLQNPDIVAENVYPQRKLVDYQGTCFAKDFETDVDFIAEDGNLLVLLHKKLFLEWVCELMRIREWVMWGDKQDYDLVTDQVCLSPRVCDKLCKLLF